MRAGEPVWAGFGVVLCSWVDLDEKIVAIEGAPSAVDIPHAFGGANAFAYYGTPRATVDIDVNAFVQASLAGEVLGALSALGVATDTPGRDDLRGERAPRFRLRAILAGASSGRTRPSTRGSSVSSSRVEANSPPDRELAVPPTAVIARKQEKLDRELFAWMTQNRFR